MNLCLKNWNTYTKVYTLVGSFVRDANTVLFFLLRAKTALLWTFMDVKLIGMSTAQIFRGRRNNG